MTGWRLGYVHGPEHVIQQMIKLQQFSFVCAPHPMQWAGLVAYDYDIADRVDEYRQKRDYVVGELRNDFEIQGGNGAFYLFMKAPWGTASEFVAAAIEKNLLIIPGNVFSSRDTHIRISYAVEDDVLEQGVSVLKNLARRGPR
jgi:aspartate aminotransferase/aminotransferase